LTLSESPYFVDSHCHLDFPDFAAERDEVIGRARRAGVGSMVTICTKVSRFDEIRQIAASDPQIWCTVGVHPHEAATEERMTAERLIGLAADPKVVGIGESGLDYFYDHSPRDVQTEQFRAHAVAAREAGLPLIVHTRDADADTAALLRSESDGGRLTGVLHCFSSGRALAETALDLGFFVSLSGIITFKAAEEIRAIVRDVPLDRLLVETDAPYLAPVPKRGKRNEPAFVVHTAAVVAELKGVSVAELARVTTDNFFGLFRKARRPEGSGR
jgi:TatD DNase family protein